MFFGSLTIGNNGFSMVLGSPNHWDQRSNDGMVSMDRTGLVTHINSSAHLVLPSKNSLDLATRKSAKITFSCGSAEGGGHTY